MCASKLSITDRNAEVGIHFTKALIKFTCINFVLVGYASLHNRPTRVIYFQNIQRLNNRYKHYLQAMYIIKMNDNK